MTRGTIHLKNISRLLQYCKDMVIVMLLMGRVVLNSSTKQCNVKFNNGGLIMSRRTIVTICVVMAVLAITVSLTSISNAHCGWCPRDKSAAKATGKADANQVKPMMAACDGPWCKAAKADPNGMAAAAKQMQCCPMAAKMNMPMCKMVRCSMTMNAQLQPTDPALLLVIKDDLQLSEEQTAKLNTILENARKETQAVLTEEQMIKVNALGKTGTTMKQMCGKMMGRGKTKDASSKKKCPLTAPTEKPAEPNN